MRLYKVYVDYLVKGNFKEIGKILDYFEYSEHTCTPNMMYDLELRGFHLCEFFFTDPIRCEDIAFIIDIDRDCIDQSPNNYFVTSSFRAMIISNLRLDKLKEIGL